MDLNFLNDNRFTDLLPNNNPSEELFARDWETLRSRYEGPAWEFLRNMCVELSFPVVEGQSQAADFLLALKRGLLPPVCEEAWVPSVPEGIRVYLHPTPVGRLPVIECKADVDFIRLQQSLVYRCEPRPVEKSRGASLIKNYNNWARLNMHRGAFGAIPHDPALYRDTIVLLSHRYYSGIEPEVFGLDPADWQEKSLIIRREHEMAHYMTQRIYHSAKNEIHDEIIADFMGLTAAFGDYDPKKFLTFLGLEEDHGYRMGGRLEIYLGGLSPEGDVFATLCTTVRQAAINIAEYHESAGGERISTFHTLCRTSVADMARGRFRNC